MEHTTNQSEFEKRTHYCAMGDVNSMMWMFWELINQVPNLPQPLTVDTWKNCALYHADALHSTLDKSKWSVHGCGAFLWLARAAFYGSQLAQEIQQTKPFSSLADNCFSLLTDNMPLESGIFGNSARMIGLPNFARDKYYRICPRFPGTIEARIDGGCCDPDEDGFGMCNEYNFYYFDEFMEQLYVQHGATVSQCYGSNTTYIKERCDIEWVKKQAIREAFWMEHQNNPTMVRYQQDKLCYQLG